MVYKIKIKSFCRIWWNGICIVRLVGCGRHFSVHSGAPLYLHVF